MLLVECVAEGAPPLGFDELRDLQARLPEAHASSLWAPDRIGVQFSVAAPSVDAAAMTGSDLWAQAVAGARLRGWVVTRMEVVTQAEREGERAALDRREVAVSSSPSDLGVLREAYLATRELLRARSVEAVAGIVSGTVYRLGGTLVPEGEGHRDTLPFDVSFGRGERMCPATGGDPVVARRIREVLPGLIEDGRSLVARLGLV